MDQDVFYRHVMFRNAGHNSTKFFFSLELLITPSKQINKQKTPKTTTTTTLNDLER
jgi:hypothetical protein